MTDSHPVKLSAAGEARRGVMLDELVGAMERVHRTRRTRRRTIAAGTPIMVGMLLWLLLPALSQSPDTPQFANPPTPEVTPLVAPPSGTPRPPLTAIVRTDPDILERYRAQPVACIERINDRMLIDTLVSIQRPAGLIYYGNRVMLTTPVTDAELNLTQ